MPRINPVGHQQCRQHLTRIREGRNARADMHCNPRKVVVYYFAFSSVQSAADFNVEPAQAVAPAGRIEFTAAEAMILESDGREGVQRGIAACEALRSEVEGWARKLPIRRQRSIYQWRHHLSLVLDDARARLRELG